jgi:hypothetical protein
VAHTTAFFKKTTSREKRRKNGGLLLKRKPNHEITDAADEKLFLFWEMTTVERKKNKKRTFGILPGRRIFPA